MSKSVVVNCIADVSANLTTSVNIMSLLTSIHPDVVGKVKEYELAEIVYYFGYFREMTQGL